jgi:organic hydroperoxide reductase OsmC/OhrA
VLISATVRNFPTRHEVCVRTGESTQALPVLSKPSGRGSAVNGGEFLMLALATCYCNDLYREAERLDISVESVVVKASADFPGIGLAATNIQYEVEVSSPSASEDIAALIRQTDAVAEVHNTIRGGAAVVLRSVDEQ